MDQELSMEDIDNTVSGKVYTQSYDKETPIEGVKIIPLKNSVGEDGDFSELMRLTNGELEAIPSFKVAQINRSKIFPGTVKAWHLHLKQDDIWHVVPSGHLLVGLWDIRQNSPTHGSVMRLSLGSGNSYLVYIPRGVAHGASNVSGKDVELLYFVNQQFDINNPDEHRIPWNAQGEDFWKAKRD